MNKFRCFLPFLTLFLLATSLFAQDIPPRPSPPRLVNDLANQLNGTEVAALEQKLVAYNDSTSTQITVVIVPTVEPYAIADYAFKLGREWGVGQKGKNNGIVLLWAPNDRKVFIATGYGMEGVVPDAIAKRIISQEIIPEFKNNMFYRGLDRGVDAIIRAAAGEYEAEATNSDEGFPGGFVVFIFILIIILIIISRNKGGGSGGRGFRNTSAGPVIWPYSTHTGWGSSSGNWGGGSSSGGGFGGFGGGSFGGGGAGGDY
ncbi:TPM domain-containing protein [Arundinibacter roseus]|uniref:TPM domain-containing protein n=1 Tax=Arundinibacter roseus TaxID=2070510 RepID=A0A4V2XAT2_9BACT|nr:TPM domain-containing protein [Arundinibacter roseus]TDB68825.1 TPM domain-containing protein [Arundinibacter roseus]